jgi:hypothetical protein
MRRRTDGWTDGWARAAQQSDAEIASPQQAERASERKVAESGAGGRGCGLGRCLSGAGTACCCVCFSMWRSGRRLRERWANLGRALAAFCGGLRGSVETDGSEGQQRSAGAAPSTHRRTPSARERGADAAADRAPPPATRRRAHRERQHRRSTPPRTAHMAWRQAHGARDEISGRPRMRMAQEQHGRLRSSLLSESAACRSSRRQASSHAPSAAARPSTPRVAAQGTSRDKPRSETALLPCFLSWSISRQSRGSDESPCPCILSLCAPSFMLRLPHVTPSLVGRRRRRAWLGAPLRSLQSESSVELHDGMLELPS